MLVINRKKDESLVLDDKFLITVKEVQQNQVILEVACPEAYSIQFEESSEQINRVENSPGIIIVLEKIESFVINSDFTVTVVDIRGYKVRLGIVVPKECPVHRKEVFDAIHGKLP